MLKNLLILLLLALTTAFARAQMIEKPFPAPDFTLNDINGKPVSLHSFKGKTVLLDFWASWCAPCRVTNRQYIALYKKYKNKGFEIISLSTDANPKRWKRAVAKDKMTWPQLIDDPDPQKNVAYRWQIRSIPRTFLIDEKGAFIAVNLPLNELDNYLQQKTSP